HMSHTPHSIVIRNTQPGDFPAIIELSRQVYPFGPPYNEGQLASQHRMFPEGQFVALDSHTRDVVGMAATLIVRWDDYDMHTNWRDFTNNGTFTNHDPVRGRTLYSAELMVSPFRQRQGIGSRIYEARLALVKRLGLLRVRAGGRLRNYHRYADRMSAEEYVIKIVRGELHDPTLSYQLKCGYHVLAVVPNYLPKDTESLGWVAIIEWINDDVAKPEDYTGRDMRFEPRNRPATPRP
ncbi:MAG: GNAT family N-acetyltransferase, partial [Nitrospira sp.]|nr:GNAT family N-acetyltransferase [Nitrospira sp.]